MFQVKEAGAGTRLCRAPATAPGGKPAAVNSLRVAGRRDPRLQELQEEGVCARDRQTRIHGDRLSGTGHYPKPLTLRLYAGC